MRRMKQAEEIGFLVLFAVATVVVLVFVGTFVVELDDRQEKEEAEGEASQTDRNWGDSLRKMTRRHSSERRKTVVVHRAAVL